MEGGNMPGISHIRGIEGARGLDTEELMNAARISREGRVVFCLGRCRREVDPFLAAMARALEPLFPQSVFLPESDEEAIEAIENIPDNGKTPVLLLDIVHMDQDESSEILKRFWRQNANCHKIFLCRNAAESAEWVKTIHDSFTDPHERFAEIQHFLSSTGGEDELIEYVKDVVAFTDWPELDTVM